MNFWELVIIILLTVNSNCFTSRSSQEVYGLPILPAKTPHSVSTRLYLSSRSRCVHCPDYELVSHLSGEDLARDLEREEFVPGKELVVIVHGYRGAATDESGVGAIKRGYIEETDLNILLVDWSDLAQNYNYHVVTENISSVAFDTSKAINQLFQIDFIGRLHLIGFSLGAQICGLMKKSLIRDIDRITALDPARPNFDHLPADQKLTSDDATFTMVVHTSGRMLSYADPIGHVDFYPNGGTAPQPNCSMDIITSLICSHKAAVDYYVHSLLHESSLVATPCNSWSDFVAGNCEDGFGPRVVMGHNTPDWARGKYYLHTGTLRGLDNSSSNLLNSSTNNGYQHQNNRKVPTPNNENKDSQKIKNTIDQEEYTLLLGNDTRSGTESVEINNQTQKMNGNDNSNDNRTQWKELQTPTKVKDDLSQRVDDSQSPSHTARISSLCLLKLNVLTITLLGLL